jgi:uncharacterized protein (DUF58 family)
VGPLSVSVSDSLGLFSPRRVLPDIRPFDVFPRVHAVGGLERLGARTSFAPSEPTTARAGRSAAYLGVRDFRPGDDVRRVHWPATARYARPMVKEFELDLTPYFTLFLDLRRDHRAGTGRKSTLEYVVRTAASLLAAAARRGDTVQLFGEGRETLALPPGRGELHLAYALDRLIRVRQDGALPLLDLFQREQSAVPPGSTVALVAASLFLDAGALAEAFDWMRARRVRPVLVAVDMDSFLPSTAPVRAPRSRRRRKRCGRSPGPTDPSWRCSTPSRTCRPSSDAPTGWRPPEWPPRVSRVWPRHGWWRSTSFRSWPPPAPISPGAPRTCCVSPATR